MTGNSGHQPLGASSGRRVDDQAAQWVARSAHGALTGAQETELEAWLAADRRHRGAYLRARAALSVLETAVIQGPPVPAAEPTRLPAVRRRIWPLGLAGAGLAAALVAALLWGSIRIPGFSPASPAVVADQIMALGDGSVVTLRNGARIAVAMSPGARRITLLGGEASFKVAKDPARPFLVQSGEVYAQATGTVYSVRRVGGQGGMVHVTEGSVLVWAGDDHDQAVLLHAGGDLTLDPGPGKPAAVPAAQPDVAEISLDGVTISAAALRFNRVNHTQIIVADPEIGRVEIVGLFKAHDPEKFAKAAAIVAGAHVVQSGGNLVLQR